MTITAEKQFDLTYNEGAEGYNPFRESRLKAEAEASLNRPVTITDLYRKLEKMDCALARECGTYDAAKVAALRSQITDLEVAQQAEFLSIWTVEVTSARRQIWNDCVRSLNVGGKVSSAALAAKTASFGWTPHDLRRAVMLRGL